MKWARPSRSKCRRFVQAAACWSVFAFVVAVSSTLLARPVGAQSDDSIADGRFLWNRDCVSCHGTSGNGTSTGPDIQGKGSAGVSLVLTTGRMPLPADAALPSRQVDAEDLQVDRGPVAYTPAEIDALVAYAGTFLAGPEVPVVDIAGADVARGAELFQINCAACHTWSGRAGALTSGQVAVSLTQATDVEVVEAMRTGLGAMPVFNRDTFDDDEADDIAAYVQYLQDPVTPLGSPLGFLGPVAEGFVAWLVGIVGLVLAIRWIGQASSTEDT